MEEKKIECEVYENIINIELFNKIIAFIMETTQNKDKYLILSQIEKNCIWLQRLKNVNFQEEYQFEYLGELLERYEERLGNNIEDIRAISLVLGYARDLIENTMFVGTQLVDFLRKVKNLAQNDIYIKGGLYLYDKEKYSYYGTDITNEVYDKTEDLLFVLSVRSDNIEYIFNKKKEMVISLLGNKRTLSVFGNIKVYAWLMRILYPLVKKIRNKNLSGIRALVKIPTGFQKEDTNIYKELIKNGYNKIEISYLNYMVLSYCLDMDSIINKGSIVEEKIAINLCKILINSENTWSDNIYNLINNLLSKYYKFNIKCYGKKGIKEALIDEINIVNPITFIKFYETFEKRLYSFDILDNKWDIVATELNKEAYESLFDDFIIKVVGKEKIIQCIEKYNKLTEANFIESFFTNDCRSCLFSFLVDNDVIILKDFFNEIIERNENKYAENYNLEKYIKGIKNRKSYDFLKYLLSLGTYGIEEINFFGFKLESLYEGGWCKKLYIQKDFLSIEEQKFLFDSLETFIFYYLPDQYIDFLDTIIETDLSEGIIAKDVLRKMYLILVDFSPKKYDTNFLREKYLTESELNEIHEKEKLQKEHEEAMKLVEMRNQIKCNFNEIVVKNFKELYRFCHHYEFYDEELKYCKDIVYSYILNDIKNFERSREDIIDLNKILNLFLQENLITIDEYININCEYWKEEVIKYGNNFRTYQASNKIA